MKRNLHHPLRQSRRDPGVPVAPYHRVPVAGIAAHPIITRPWVIAILLLAVATSLAETLTVNVTTEGPREGSIDILVFNSKKGFPNKPAKAFRRVRIPVGAEGPVECAITNLPYGVYSLSVLHDVNNNLKPDKKLAIGPPTEPVGFSNIDQKTRKKPSYESTLFTFGAQTNEIAISLWYVL